MTAQPEIDETLLTRAINNLGISESMQSYALSKLRHIGDDSNIYRSSKAAQPWSKTLKDLKILDSAVTKLSNELGGTTNLNDLRQAMDASPALAISVFKFAEQTNPNRKKHSPLEDKLTCQRLESFLCDLKTFKEAIESNRKNVASKLDGKQGGNRHEQDWALQETAWHLLRLYYELTNKVPGVSKPSSGGNPTGPAVRFLDLCLNAYGWNTKPTTAKNLIDNLKNDPELPWTAKS